MVHSYQEFIDTLSLVAEGGLFFHRIEDEIYITDYKHSLLGVWNLKLEAPCILRPTKYSSNLIF